MRKKVGIIKRVSCIGLVFLLSINTFAAIVSDNDGAAFITKAEFDALKNDFQSQIDSYNTSIDNKIDGAIASYLAGISLATEQDLTAGNNYDAIESDMDGKKIQWFSAYSAPTTAQYPIPSFDMIVVGYTDISSEGKNNWVTGRLLYEKPQRYKWLNKNGRVDGEYDSQVGVQGSAFGTYQGATGNWAEIYTLDRGHHWASLQIPRDGAQVTVGRFTSYTAMGQSVISYRERKVINNLQLYPLSTTSLYLLDDSKTYIYCYGSTGTSGDYATSKDEAGEFETAMRGNYSNELLFYPLDYNDTESQKVITEGYTYVYNGLGTYSYTPHGSSTAVTATKRHYYVLGKKDIKVRSLTTAKNANAIVLEQNYKFLNNISTPIKYGIPIIKAAKDGEIKLKITPSAAGHFVAYTAGASGDILWGGLANKKNGGRSKEWTSSDGTTEWAGNTENTCTASTERVIKLDIKKDEYLWFLYLPNSGSATVKINQITETISK